MDFHAWFEVYLADGDEGRWWTFDARFNRPLIGRIPIGIGRDAVDVPMMTTYGPASFRSMTVIWCDDRERPLRSMAKVGVRGSFNGKGETVERDDLDTLIGTLGAVDHLDHRGMDWGKVRWTAYLIHQHLRYEYPGRVHDLRQRLMIVPPDQHGGQRLVTHKLEVSAPGVVPVERPRSRSATSSSSSHVERIEQAIDFTAWIVVEREARAVHPTVTPEVYADPALRQPSPLTGADDALRAAATELRAAATDDLALARLINAWVYGAD